MPGTCTFHRVLKAPPERVYKAFTDADALASWLPPNGFTGHVHEFSAKPGSSYIMSFTNFTTGQIHKWSGVYVELEPNRKLRYKEKFDDPNMPGEMETTVELNAVSSGTEIRIVQNGIPDAIPVDGCYVGWQESLVKLAMLTEPEIQDG